MPDYFIHPYTKKQANKHKLVIYPAQDGKHKLEVYDYDGDFLGRVGAYGYLDYPQYLALEDAELVPPGTACERRRLYHLRHRSEKNYDVKFSRSWLAKTLLW